MGRELRSWEKTIKHATCTALLAVMLPAFFIADAGETSPAISKQPPTTRPATQPAKTKEQLKQEEIDRVMEFFRIAQPDLYEQAKALQKCDPAKFEEKIHKAVGTVNRLERLKKKNRPLFDMEMKDFQLEYNTLRLGKDIKRPDIPPSDRDEKIRQLSNLVAEQFDLRQKIRQAQIDDLQKQLAALEKQLQDRDAQKEDLIKKRINDLIQSVPQLEW